MSLDALWLFGLSGRTYCAHNVGFRYWYCRCGCGRMEGMVELMKLDPVYPDIVNRFQYVKKTNADAWQKYVKSVIAEHKYNDLLTRIAWDLLRYVYTSGTICEWYDKYNVHDSHITTAVKKAYVEVFGMPSE